MPEAGGPARVLAVSFLGSLCRVQVELPAGTGGRPGPGTRSDIELSPGTAVRVTVLPAPVFAVAG